MRICYYQNNYEALRMDFNPGRIYPLWGSSPIPFYLAYPDYTEDEREEQLRDWEYLQETYPKEIKEYQKKVSDILERMDYEGSMIYDEYPDRLQLRGLAETIGRILQAERDKSGLREENQELLLMVLTCEEIYKRRQTKKKRADAYWDLHRN